MRGSFPKSPVQRVSLGQQTVPSGAHARVSTTSEHPPGLPLGTLTYDPPLVSGSTPESSTPVSVTRPRARAVHQAAQELLEGEIAQVVGYNLLLLQTRVSISANPYDLGLRWKCSG